MKATRQTIPTLIEKREAFTNSSGTVIGIRNPQREHIKALLSKNTPSQLNEDEKTRLRIDHEQSGIAYIVFSYDTPIAWETKNGHIYKVQQTFTQTTSKHQGMLYQFHEKQSTS